MANEHRLLGSLYPTAEVQQQRLQELERVKQEHLAAQAAERWARTTTGIVVAWLLGC